MVIGLDNIHIINIIIILLRGRRTRITQNNKCGVYVKIRVKKPINNLKKENIF